MARVTIEDCIDSIANRFQLVMCSAQRGRELASGVEPTVERDRLIKHEKNAVIALREITQGNLDVEALEDSIVRSYRRFSPIEDAAEEGAEEGAQLVATSAEILPEVKAEDEPVTVEPVTVEAVAVEAVAVEVEAVAVEVEEVEAVEDKPVAVESAVLAGDVVSDEEISDKEGG